MSSKDGLFLPHAKQILNTSCENFMLHQADSPPYMSLCYYGRRSRPRKRIDVDCVYLYIFFDYVVSILSLLCEAWLLTCFYVFLVYFVVIVFIVWQGSSEVNLRVLIGFFLGRDLTIRTDRFHGHKPYYGGFSLHYVTVGGIYLSTCSVSRGLLGGIEQAYMT